MIRSFIHKHKAWLAFVAILLLATNCYKEDAQVLYSRQYIIPELTAWRDSVNNSLKEIQTGLQALNDKGGISDVTYKVVGNDTIGVNITLGTKKIYLPYGKAGNRSEITLGENGNWFINGKDTGKSWRGAKGDTGATGANGLTPIFGIKQDTDQNFYWTIKWPGDAEPNFIKEANGQKVRANGANGTPGVDSPLREVTESDEGWTFTIQYPESTGTTPNPKTITIPKSKKLSLQLHPDQATNDQQPLPEDRYDAEKNLLTFKANQEIAIPYEKSDDLTKIVCNLPTNWTSRIDDSEKKVYVKAPSFRSLTTSAHQGLLVVTAKTPEGLAYQSEVNLKIETMFYLDFFFATDNAISTQPAESPFNEISLDVACEYEHHFSMHKLENKAYKNITYGVLNDNMSTQERNDRLKHSPYLNVSKDNDFSSYTFGNLIYDKNELEVQHEGDRKTEPDGFYLARKQKDGNYDELSTNKKAIFVRPVPRDTYGAFEVIDNTGDGAYYHTIRLRCLTQKIVLRMSDPKKHLGLLDSEQFDASRVVLYHGTSFGRTMNDDSKFIYLTIEEKPRYLTTKAENAVEYDATKDLLTGAFYQFPVTRTESYKLFVQYTTSDGKKIVKVLRAGHGLTELYNGGSELTYNLNVPTKYGARILNDFVKIRDKSGTYVIQPTLTVTEIQDTDEF